MHHEVKSKAAKWLCLCELKKATRTQTHTHTRRQVHTRASFKGI